MTFQRSEDSMIRQFVALILLLVPFQAFAADDGVVRRESRYSVPQTLDRLEGVLRDRGIIVFARIDHAGEAAKVGLELPPTQLLIFGSPRAGTPLMAAHPTIAIDLPMKALAWQDSAGKVWIGFNSVDYMQKRYGLTDGETKSLAVVGGLIEAALK
jgi:uncharacterized protein (DUF302 family)